jgi:hypothetical protein
LQQCCINFDQAILERAHSALQAPPFLEAKKWAVLLTF